MTAADISAAESPAYAPTGIGWFIFMALVSAVLFLVMVLEYADRILEPSYFLWLTTLIFVIGGYLQFLLLFRRRLALFAFNLFFLYDIFPVWLGNYVMGIDFSSWRAGRFAPHQLETILTVDMIYICWYYVVAFLCLIYLERKGPDAKTVAVIELDGHPAGRWIFTLICFAVAVLGVYGAGIQPRLEIIKTVDVEGNFVIRFSMAALIAVFTIAAFRFDKSKKLLSPTTLALLVSGILIGINGYRNTAVAVMMIAAAHYIFLNRITWKMIILGILGFFPLLGFLILLGVARRLWMSPVDLITSGILFRIPTDVVLSNFGAPQQVNFIATGHFLHLHKFLDGRTYLESVINILPNAIRSGLGAKYPQEYILNAMQGVLPISFLDQAGTMGASLPLEAMVNFGTWGPIYAVTAFVWIFTLMEKHRQKNVYALILYLSAVATMFFPTWYGSTAFLKTSVAFPLGLSWLIFMLLKWFGVNPRVRIQRLSD